MPFQATGLTNQGPLSRKDGELPTPTTNDPAKIKEAAKKEIAKKFASASQRPEKVEGDIATYSKDDLEKEGPALVNQGKLTKQELDLALYFKGTAESRTRSAA
ncbi:hypothetical protein DSO57_1013381 [Entomophthora muscae]|uniref:Uncharacterized protein n=1 Tax=Entomophthora muscae TaxID=34485 RepID=A0ACC2S7Q6_9FUNG|nr:hypothetical protein DSO57_1013381 [Entomophthora muscae]